MTSLRAAAVQFNHAPGDKEYNLGRITDFTRQAAAGRVELIVFPEMCITGYWHVRKLTREQVEGLAEPIPSGPSTQTLVALAREHNMSVGAGLIERDDDGRMYNSYVVAMPNGSFARHRKLHCFVSEYMTSGNEYTVFDLPSGVRAGILICYDNNIIENVRITALMGAEVLLAPHQTGGCSPKSPGAMGLVDPALWHRRREDPEAIEAEFRGPKGRGWVMRWLPSRAHDNGMYLVFSNGVGLDDDEVRTGGSMILDPYGRVIVETGKADDDMVIADLDREARLKSTGVRWIKTRRPDLYKPLTVPIGVEQDTRTVRFATE